VIRTIWEWIASIWRVEEPRRVNHHMNILMPKGQKRKEVNGQSQEDQL
jgi:hypothetical protein